MTPATTKKMSEPIRNHSQPANIIPAPNVCCKKPKRSGVGTIGGGASGRMVLVIVGVGGMGVRVGVSLGNSVAVSVGVKGGASVLVGVAVKKVASAVWVTANSSCAATVVAV